VAEPTLGLELTTSDAGGGYGNGVGTRRVARSSSRADVKSGCSARAGR